MVESGVWPYKRFHRTLVCWQHWPDQKKKKPVQPARPVPCTKPELFNCSTLYLFIFYLHLFFGSIYSQTTTFLFLHFLLGYVFLLCHPLFRFRNDLLFQWDFLSFFQHGRDWVNPPRALNLPPLGGFVHLCSVARASASKPFSSALLSASLNMYSKNNPLDYRPCVQPPFGLSAPTNSTIVTTELHGIHSVKGYPSDTWWLFRCAYPKWPGPFHKCS